MIDATPSKWVRVSKLTLDQVRDIRRRVDSLTVPWTLAGLAEEFGVSTTQISAIARRRVWAERAWEPENQPYWRVVEIEKMLADE